MHRTGQAMDGRLRSDLPPRLPMTWQEKDERDRREMLANELAAKAGTVIQCGCCFDSFAFENLVQCTEGHLFCRSCLRRSVQGLSL